LGTKDGDFGKWPTRTGDPVSVVLIPEGPHSEELAADIVAPLAAEPDAAQFFDGLATFYRKKYLRWIDGTKRRPDLRAQRIAELIELMKAGKKEGPRYRPPRLRLGPHAKLLVWRT
jgi:Bacteriocin-protection, YdeI or OmpD-Associated